MSYYILGLIIASLIAAAFWGPPAWGMKRLLRPAFILPLIKRRGPTLARVLNRIRADLDLALLVKVTNRYFRRSFADTTFSQRLVFLPFCLCPRNCPAPTDPQIGLSCQGQCPDCELGRVRNEALALGYARVYVVPSSRMMRGKDLLPSDEFIQKKLKEHDPSAALGVTCGWYLRNRLLAKYEVGDAGYHQDGGSERNTVFQGVLLAARNCRQAKVDWEKVRRLLRQHNHRPPVTPAAAGAGDSADLGA